jgi:hypothetical protein
MTHGRAIAFAALALCGACTGMPSSTEGAQSTSVATVGAGGSGANMGVGGSTGGQHVGGAPPLLDDGLIARYFIDEADSGQGPTELVDAAPDPVPLAITYIPQMSFAEKDGHRGLEFTTEGLDGRASVLADGTKFQTRLAGAMTATMEAVVEIAAVTSSGSRIMHMGAATSTEWWFSMGTGSVNRMDISIEDDWLGYFVVPLTVLGRVVLHSVIDNTQTDPEARTRFYANGGITPRIWGTPFDQDHPFDIPAGKYFVVGNREVGQRTIRGINYYVAVYDIAFSEAQVQANASALLASDDHP